MDFKTMHKQRVAILIVAVIGVISTFLPWASASIDTGMFGSLNETANGLNGNGWIAFFGFIAAGILAFLGDQKTLVTSNDNFKWGVVGSGGAATVIAFLNIVNTNSGGFQAFGVSASVSLGFGVFLAILAGGIITAIPFLDPKTFDKLPIGADASTESNTSE